MPNARKQPVPGPESIADLGFLISQVGDHSQAYFGVLVEPLGLRTSHVGVLRAIHAAQGPTQRELGERLGTFASNLVKLIDELELRGLVERLQREDDRRSYQLRLTREGERSIRNIETKVREHQNSMCASLTSAERYQLHRLLRKIAADRELKPGVHPELSRGKKSKQE